MMNQIKQILSRYKNVIIGGILLVAMLVAYNIFYLGPKKEAEDAGAIRSENQNLTSSQIGREIVTTLNRLKTLNIDPDFFLEERFGRLVDFSVEIKEQPVGKNNPFSQVDVLASQSLDGEVEGVAAFEQAVEEEEGEEDTQLSDGAGI